MKLAEALAQLVPSAKAMGVIFTLAAGAFMAGVGAVLGFGEYADLPEDVAVLQSNAVVDGAAIASLRRDMTSAARERTQILCLVRLTAEGEPLSPLQVNERCP